MAPIAKEPDSLTSALSKASATTPSGAKSQPAAVEIPVTVNGARTVEGSDKREPFSENTQTVLVFANGAVIRLSSAVASGQLLFLTNERSKKEVVCQVVKSKSYSSVSGYVELEFTEAAPGFWGVRFPTNGQTTYAPSGAQPSAAVPASSSKSLEEKITETRAKAPAVPAVANAPKIGASKPVFAAQLPQQPRASVLAEPNELKVAPVVPAQPPSTVAKVPTLSEFLTQGESGPALKAPEKTKPESTQKKPEASIQDLKQQAAHLQDQLASKVFAPQRGDESKKGDSLSRLLVPPAAKEHPAPGTSTFDFGEDEVKIPAWLEPLARNSSPNPATQAPVTTELDTKSIETKTSETKFSDISLSESGSREEAEVESSSADLSTDDSAKHGAAFTISAEGPTPNFGSSLALDTHSVRPEPGSKGSGQGLILGVAAAALLFAAGGGWYWYSNQPKEVSASGVKAAQNNFAAPAASNTVPATAATESVKPGSGSTASDADANRTPATPQFGRTESREVAASPSGLSKSAATASPAGAKTDIEQHSLLPAPAVEAVKRPSLGKVHLAAPTVGGRVSSSENGFADAAPSMSVGDVTIGDTGSLNILANKGNQPAAPLPVGGNVKTAQLLSSVAPIYPQLARNQRLSGDVKIDALIGENGHVSAMKVMSGPALLHQAAMDALRQWKYQPATLNGQPMAMHLTVTVQFKLQ